MVLDVKRIDGLKWLSKDNKGYYMEKGFALYNQGLGYLKFKTDKTEVPYIPCGGKKALQDIIDAGGLTHYNDVEWLKPIEG